MRWRWRVLTGGTRRRTARPPSTGWASPNITQRCSARLNGEVRFRGVAEAHGARDRVEVEVVAVR